MIDYTTLTNEELLKLYKTTQNTIAANRNAEQSIKISINSLYGAVANQYFKFYDLRMAEAITLTGQTIIQWGDKAFNDYYVNTLKFPKADYVHYCDTDSVTGDSLVYVDGKQIPISELYDSIESNFTYADSFNKNYVKPVIDIITKSFNTQTKQIEDKKINYIMKHTVKKEMFKITTSDGKSVIITEDHSVIIKRNGRYMCVSPRNINTTIDKVINICI
jgi:hypothetical protein